MVIMEITWQRRNAIYTPRVDMPNIGLTKGQRVLCEVWGCFQRMEGDGAMNPYFVVELLNGQCTYVAPEDIQFTREGEVNAQNSD